MVAITKKNNLVRLSLQKHYYVHSLLPLFTKGYHQESMIFAWWRMSNRKGVIVSPEDYANLKDKVIIQARRKTRAFFQTDEGKKTFY